MKKKLSVLSLLFLLFVSSCTDDNIESMSTNSNLKKNEIEEISIKFASSIIDNHGTRSFNHGTLQIQSINKLACSTLTTRTNTSYASKDTAISVSFDNNQGTVILLKNQSDILPIAFFSRESNINLNKEIKDTTSEMSFLIQQTMVENSGKVTAVNSFKAEENLEIVERLNPKCKVAWHQGAPYNKYCPLIDGQRAAAGCVAIAGAQAITVLQPPMPAVKSWETLINATPWDTDTTAINQVAELISSTGLGVGMNYGIKSSGAQTENLSNLFAQFGIKDYDCDRAIDVLKTKHGVIVVSGYRATHGWGPWKHYVDGHAFIADGYIKYNEGDDPYYLHVNYGAGDGNAYRDVYLLSARKSWKEDEARKIYDPLFVKGIKYFSYTYENEANWK